MFFGNLRKSPQISGNKEIKDKSVTIRKLGSEKQETKKVNNAIKEFKQLNNLPIN